VTGTVESQSLICASIMSKKLAEGIDALVLDVKTGSGAFMKREEDAVALAELMVETGERMGKRTAALITDMDQPLGREVGNSLEILECIEVLRNERDPMSRDLRELSLELAAWMFFLGERTGTVEAGRVLAAQMLASGKALSKFKDMLRLQGGGDISVVDKPSRMPRAAHDLQIRAESAGFVQRIECEQVGIASLLLGGGRSKKDDVVDHAVGITLHKKTGDAVLAGETLAILHYNSDARLDEAQRLLQSSYAVGSTKPQPRPLVLRSITSTKQKAAV
jgi:pyrimidine-nucleoside phosphorylase